MEIKNRTLSLLFSLLLIVVATDASARLLTPLTTETYVQVEINALEHQIVELHQQLGSPLGEITTALPDTTSLDAIYKRYNTNFMEHLRYGDAHKREINRWLEQNPQQATWLEQFKNQLEQLSSQLESRETH